MTTRSRARAALLGAVGILALGSATSAAAEAEPVGDPNLPWLDNPYYKLFLDVRARMEFADIEGFSDSQAYTIRTRAGLGSKPYFGFSAFAELENTWSLDDGSYFDGASAPNGESVIADPENIELNRAWLQFEKKEWLGMRAKGGRQRMIWDDARFIGNVGWRQNEQTYDAALGETTLGVEGLSAWYAYVWDVRRIFGDQGPSPTTQDFDSNSHLARVSHQGLDFLKATAFMYLLDFDQDSPPNSSNSYGLRLWGDIALSEDLSLSYAASYAYQTDAADNPVDYEAHYVWLGADVGWKSLGSLGVLYERLGSDDGDAVFVTPLATAHKFNGFADAFLDNGGPRGLQDLGISVAPIPS